MSKLPDDPTATEGNCDRCGTKVYRFHGQGDLECPKCGAFYNSFGQRLRDDLRTRPNPSEHDENIGDLEGDEEISPEERQKRMILTPDKWPMWPRLPMKKPGTWTIGVIVETEDPGIVLIEGNMYTDLSEAPRLEFKDAEAVWDAGWRVD